MDRGFVAGLAARLVPPTPTLRSYAFANFINSIGTGLYTTGAVVFFVRSLHLSATYAGAGLTIAGGVGLLASLPGGWLADHQHFKQIYVALFGVLGLLFAVFPLVRGRVWFVVIVSAIALVQNAATPVRQVLMSRLVGSASRVAVSAYNRSILNVGISIGALLAVASLAIDSEPAYDALLVGNALSFLAAGALLARMSVPERSEVAAAPTLDSVAAAQAQRSSSRHPLLHPRFAAAAVSCGVLCLNASILDVALPLQVSQHTTAPRWIIAFLFLMNTVLAVSFQVRASRGSHTVRGAARANRVAGLALFGTCVLFPLAGIHVTGVAIMLLFAATLLLTAGELYSSAGTWGMSYGLAPEEQQGRYLGSFDLLSQAIQLVGPLLAAAVVAAGTGAWLVLAIVFLATGLLAPYIISGARPELEGTS